MEKNKPAFRLARGLVGAVAVALALALGGAPLMGMTSAHADESVASTYEGSQGSGMRITMVSPVPTSTPESGVTGFLNQVGHVLPDDTGCVSFQVRSNKFLYNGAPDPVSFASVNAGNLRLTTADGTQTLATLNAENTGALTVDFGSSMAILVVRVDTSQFQGQQLRIVFDPGFISNYGQNDYTLGRTVSFLFTTQTAHAFGEYTSNNDATCTADGTKSAPCTLCDTVSTVTDEGSAAGVEHVVVVDAATEATCTADGLAQGTHCERCGVVLIPQEVATPALGHMYVDQTHNGDATCTKDGTKVVRCSRCGEAKTVTDERSALGHSWSEYRYNNDATCTNDGTKTRTCARCEESETIRAEGTALGGGKGHAVVADKAVAATCTMPGLTAGSHCSFCGEILVRQVMVAPLGHEYAGGLCASCGAKEPAATEPSYEGRQGGGLKIAMASPVPASTLESSAVGSLNRAGHVMADNGGCVYFQVQSDKFLYGDNADPAVFASVNAGRLRVTTADGSQTLAALTANNTGALTIGFGSTRSSLVVCVDLSQLQGQEFRLVFDEAFTSNYGRNDYALGKTVSFQFATEHVFGEYASNGDATCTADGTKTAMCAYCGVTDTVTDKGTALGHESAGGTCIRCNLGMTGWEVGDNGRRFYENGVMATGWKSVDGLWYYLGDDGVAATGWQKLSGKWYYMIPETGAMATGWQDVSGKAYCFASNGAMMTGWQKLSGRWHYLGTGGAAASGWQKVSGTWYYFDPETLAMATGWKEISGTWYCFASNGAMMTGWQKVGSTWYYFTPGGAMVTGTQAINGKTYNFSSSGAWVG